MNLNDFLAAVTAIKSTTPLYQLGHTGDDGFCDCIGLIIGAVERCDVKWSGIHGSNYWARHYTSSLMRVTDADDLSLGDLVYKARAPGATGYDLPDRYKNDPDRLDYYHVGVVTSVNPPAITHCTKGGGVDGITVDTKLGKWTYKGQLTLLDGYNTTDREDDGTMATKAMVYADNGKPVNLRRRPSTSTARLTTVPVGTVVDVYEVDDGWAHVKVNGEEGYMMAEYLRPEEMGGVEDAPDAAGQAAVLAQLVKDMAALLDRVDALEDRVAALEGGVG